MSEQLLIIHSYAQIAQNVYYDPASSKTMLHITDFTTNPLFWENSTFRGYPPEKIIFSIAFFDCAAKVNQIKSLKQGDRVFLSNIRVKSDSKFGILEGHVGTNSAFKMRTLAIDETRSEAISKAYEKTSYCPTRPVV